MSTAAGQGGTGGELAAARPPGEPTLAEVQAEFRQWRCTRGNNGLYYAWHETSGQQVRGEDPLDLRDQIKAAQGHDASNPEHQMPGATEAPIA